MRRNHKTPTYEKVYVNFKSAAFFADLFRTAGFVVTWAV